MAEKKILNSELIQKDVFGDTKKSAEDALALVEKLITAFKLLKKESDKVLNKKGSPRTAQELKDITTALDNSKKAREGLNKSEAAYNKLLKEKLDLEKKLETQKKSKKNLTDAEIKAAEVQRVLDKDRITVLKQMAILESNQLGLEKKLVASNTLLRIRREQLNIADKNYQTELKKINSQIDKNNALINKNADALKQQKINVGNYTRSIHAALSETGLFNGTIANLIISLKNLLFAEDAAAKGARTLSNTLKALGIGAIIALIAAMNKFVQSSQAAIDNIDIWIAKAKDFFTSVIPGMTGGFEEATIATKKFIKEVRELQKEIQKLTLDEQDQAEISEDVTLGYTARNNALKESIKLREELAAKNVKLAKLELEEIERDILLSIKNGLSPLNDVLDARLQAQLKYNAALDEQDDLTRKSGERLRQQKINELQLDIDLLNSKKKSSTAQVDLLKAQIADEKAQIADRQKYIDELNIALKKSFDEQIKLFNDATGRRIDGNELLAISDNVVAAQYIKGLELGVQATEILATIRKKAQDAQILAAEQQKKLDEDKIQRDLRIAQINRDIALEKEQDRVNDLEFSRQQEQLEIEKLRLKVNNNLFDRKSYNELKELLNTQSVLETDLYEEKLKQLDLQRIDETKKAKATINDIEERNAELVRIQEKYNIDVENLEQENKANTAKLNQEAIDEFEEIEKKKLAIVSENLAKIGTETQNQLDKKSQREQDDFDRSISKREDTIKRQEELAALGLDNELAFQKAKLDKEELQRKDALERAQKQKEAAILVEAYFNAFNAELKQPGSNPQSAAGKALADVLLAKGVAKGLVQFALEGNEDVQAAPGQKAEKGKDSIPFMLAPGEAVIKESSNKKYKGVAKALNAGEFEKIYQPRFKESSSFAENVANSVLLAKVSKTNELLEDLVAKPVQNWKVNQFGELVEKWYQKGKQTNITHKRPRLNQ